ncbi:MAG: FG-GAP-like repeat-containing protein [Acidobacteriota bacterium]
MPRRRLCAFLTLLAAPGLVFSATIHTANHTQTCTSCGDNAFYHADFNNDGFEDLAYIQDLPMGGNPNFVVKFSNKDGSYSSGTSYKVPEFQGSDDSIAQLVLGDFFNDGNMDIVAFTWESGKAYLYRNNGKGTFTLSGSFQYGPSGGPVNTISAVTADFNHDGKLDLAYILNQQLEVWAGNGEGAFSSGLSQSVSGVQLAIGDFDGDGKADLLVYNDPASISTATVYYGDETGHFPDSATLGMSQGYVAFSIGDVNGDGKSDVIAVDPTIAKSRVYVFYGDAARKFASRTSMLTGRCVSASPVQVADLDGNGLNDLIVQEQDCSNPNGGALYVDALTRNPDSSYNPDQTLYWAQKTPDGNIYEIAQPTVVLRANQDSAPDLLVQQCADSYCYSHYNTTMFNTTSGNFNSCSAPWAAEGINVCSPLSGQSASSPVRFQIAAAGPVPMRDVEVWIDGSKRAEQIDGYSYYTFLDQSVTLTPGSHNVTVFGAGWDQSLVRKSFTVNVQ